MTAITTRSIRSTEPDTITAARPGLVRTGLLAAVLGAAATEVFAAVLRAAGVHLAAGSIGGGSEDVADIGPGACAIMVALCVADGLVLAAGIRRRAQRPRRTWWLTAVALTVVSFVPDVLAGSTATSSRVGLIAAHVVAAAVVIPVVGRSLATKR